MFKKQKQNSADVNHKKKKKKKSPSVTKIREQKIMTNTQKNHLVHSNKSSQFKHLRQGPFCAITPKTSSQRCAA